MNSLFDILFYIVIVASSLLIVTGFLFKCPVAVIFGIVIVFFMCYVRYSNGDSHLE